MHKFLRSAQRKGKRTPLPGELPPFGDSARRKDKRQRKKARRDGRPPKGIYAAIAVLLFCAVGMVLWVNRENLKPANISEWVQTQMLGLSKGSGFPVHLTDENVQPCNFIAANKELFLTSDTAVQAYNSSAKQLFSRKHSLSSAVMKVNGNRVLVYNLGGTGYRLESQLKTLVDSSTDGKLLGGAVCANGRFALLTEEDGYCGQLTVYQQNGQVAYQYSFSEYYPTAVAVNSDGTHAVVTAVGASGGALVSAVYELDFNSNQTVKPAATYADTTFLDVAYTSFGILAVGDTQTVALDSAGKTLGAYSYGDAQLAAWNLNSSTAVLGLLDFRNATASHLTAVNAQGKVQGSAKVDGSIVSVSQYADVMAVLSSGKVSAFTTSGKAVGSCSAGSNARAVALRSANQVFLLDVSEIRLETLRG
ncbi:MULTISPECIES: DUF5711 family protein [Caproicibacterium]|uniref:DUF5711 family protein n=1 Tax=Caproicibacterium argilliputei TaxID=3030016 RepID=A0AA97D7B9_9FIRM|nr:DUF5711 family protein [Caproicibacterium argilliputei]WOC31669.1 DUF5711 family protein [Caproicibacterium argilliputei]